MKRIDLTLAAVYLVAAITIALDTLIWRAT